MSSPSPFMKRITQKTIFFTLDHNSGIKGLKESHCIIEWEDFISKESHCIIEWEDFISKESHCVIEWEDFISKESDWVKWVDFNYNTAALS